MHDDEKPSRAAKRDPVEEAAAGSFPASDPPAWTAARSGHPRVDAAGKGAAHDTAKRCQALGRFASPEAAQAAADALLASGFNLVDICPTNRPGADPPARPLDAASLGVWAGFGALAAGAVAALFGPKGFRYVLAAAAGGAVGAVSARAAGRRAEDALLGGRGATLLRVRLRTPDDQKPALAILEGQGARNVEISWTD